MKKVMIGSAIVLAAGSTALMVYALNNKKTKQTAAKLVNNAMKVANKKIESIEV